MTEEEIKRIYELINNDELKVLIDKLIKERNNLLNEVTYDVLTKTHNRRILNKETKYDIVIMCDVDNFKEVNDMFGHDAGDKILKTVSELLQSITREGDFVCRYGGDEFVIVLKNCSSSDAKNKLEIVNKEFEGITNLGIGVSLSFGITEYEENKTLEEAIKEADQALYISKNNGKNKISVYKKR